MTPAEIQDGRPALSPGVLDGISEVLAAFAAARGGLGSPQWEVLQKSGVSERLGLTRMRLEERVRHALQDMGDSLCSRSWLGGQELEWIDDRLDAVVDPGHRLLLCELAWAMIHAEGPPSTGERLVHEHLCARWHVRPAVN